MKSRKLFLSLATLALAALPATAQLGGVNLGGAAGAAG
jgi:hypothetical protein